MVDSDGVFRLTFVEGRGLLALGSRDFHALGHVDRLELEIPNLRFPFDLSGGVARFKNCRLDLRELALSIAGEDVTAALSQARLPDFGLFDPQVELDGAEVRLGCRAVIGGHEAEVTAHGTLQPWAPASARIHVHDLFVFGFLPVPAPSILKAFFLALEGPTSDPTSGTALPPLVSAISPAEFQVELLELVLLAILPMQGWRMPKRKDVQLRLLAGTPGNAPLSMVFSQRNAHDDDPLTLPPEPHEIVRYREYTGRIGVAEEALLHGDLATTQTLLQTYDPIESRDEFATLRLLQLFLASEETLTLAGKLASQALDRWPSMLPASIAQAVVAGKRQQYDESAAIYERVAEQLLASQKRFDASRALVAAAQSWAAAGQKDQATQVLERAMDHRLHLHASGRVKVLRLAVEDAWDKIPRQLCEETRLDGSGVIDEVFQLLELVNLGGLAKDAKIIQQAVQSLESLLSGETWPAGEVSRAEAAYQLARHRLTENDVLSATHWFNVCIAAKATASLLANAWQGLAEVLATQPDRERYAEALVGWASDARTGESRVLRAARLRQAAVLWGVELGRIPHAITLLEEALRILPVDTESLSLLADFAEQERAAVVAALRHHLGEIRPDEAVPVLRLLAKLLGSDPTLQVDARDIYQLLVELDPQDSEAAYQLACLTWACGDRPSAVKQFLNLLTLDRLTEAQFTEIHLLLSEWAHEQDKPDEARQHLDIALSVDASDPFSVERICHVLYHSGDFTRLCSFLDRKGIALPQGLDPEPLVELRLAAAEKSGDMAQIESLLRELLKTHPDDLGLVRRLAACYRATNQIPLLVETLVRAWDLWSQQTFIGYTADFQREGLELANLLLTQPEGRALAKKVLERLLERVPDCAPAMERLGAILLAEGAMLEADALFIRQLKVTPEQGVSSLLLLRARARIEEEGGAKAALSLLKSQSISQLDDEVLALRTQLAEEVGDSIDALDSLLVLYRRAKPETRATLMERLRTYATLPSTPLSVAQAFFTELMRDDPNNQENALAFFDVLGRVTDTTERMAAWQDLIERFPGLPLRCRANLQLVQAQEALKTGDHAAATAALEEARILDNSPEAQTAQRVVRAHLYTSQGMIERARLELDEVLAQVPLHAEALALAGDLAYRMRDWEKAKVGYATLNTLDDKAHFIPLDLLLIRRAELAEMFGDRKEIETAYRELAQLDPQHIGAREALADVLLHRGEFTEAVFYLREVLRLLPKDAVERLTLARHHLGLAYLQLGDFLSARQNFELALSTAPERAPSLDGLSTTLQKLGLHHDAAAVCERLARVTLEPPMKAEVLFRKGEILRRFLHDVEGANDAYLRSSDCDPTFGPTLGRLVLYYWEKADLKNLAEVGTDLVMATVAPREDPEELGLLVALAAMLDRKDEGLARKALESPLLGAPLRPAVAARRLGELIGRVAPASLPSLDTALSLLSTQFSSEFQTDLAHALQEAVLVKPNDAGLSMVLGRLWERLGKKSLARSAYSLAQFVDFTMGADLRLAELGNENRIRDGAWHVGKVDHLLCQGALRRVLCQFAPALALLHPEDRKERPPLAPLTADHAARCDELRLRMKAPNVPIGVQGEGMDVTLAPTPPLSIILGRKAESLSSAELAFYVARALEQVRGGTLAVVRASAFQLHCLVQALAYVTRETELPSEEAPEAAVQVWITRLAAPDVRAVLPVGEDRQRLQTDAALVLADLPDLESYLRGCRFTADRVGLLACGQPLVALRALAGVLKADYEGPPSTGFAHRPKEMLLALPALRELVAFLLSDDYAESTEEN
jgi:tetratricopeptide (TPR) repeat protein